MGFRSNPIYRLALLNNEPIDKSWLYEIVTYFVNLHN